MSDSLHLSVPVDSLPPTLAHELAQAAPLGGTFAPVLAAMRVCAKAPAGQACEHCCHWSLPLDLPYRNRSLPAAAAMLYHEWLTWHLHVVTHQGGVLVS